MASNAVVTPRAERYGVKKVQVSYWHCCSTVSKSQHLVSLMSSTKVTNVNSNIKYIYVNMYTNKYFSTDTIK